MSIGESGKDALEPAKPADPMILDKNPLNMDPMAIKASEVPETVWDGRTIFAARLAPEALAT
jgi:hypothetical protein